MRSGPVKKASGTIKIPDRNRQKTNRVTRVFRLRARLGRFNSKYRRRQHFLLNIVDVNPGIFVSR
jgi:hypothetical protein